MLEQSKNRFLREGGSLQHKKVVSLLHSADEEARVEATRLAAPPHKRAAGIITEALSLLAVAFFFVVLVVGVGIVILVIPIAEFSAVLAGLNYLTPDANVVAALLSFAAFIGILVLMFLRHVYEDSLPGDRPQTGLRHLRNRFFTWAGSTEYPVVEWSKVESDFVRLTAALNATKIAVVSISLVGRLKPLLTAHGTKPVGDAINSIGSLLTGQELISATVSLLLLLGLLRMLDIAVLFCYTAFKNSAGSLDLAKVRPTSFLDEYERLRETYQARILDDLTMQLQIKNENN